MCRRRLGFVYKEKRREEKRKEGKSRSGDLLRERFESFSFCSPYPSPSLFAMALARTIAIVGTRALSCWR